MPLPNRAWIPIVCLTLALALVSCTKNPTPFTENGSGYGGGDPLNLKIARRNILLSLAEMSQGYGVDRLGEYNGCANANDATICNLVGTATIPQRSFARKFLLASLNELIAFNRREKPIQFKLLGSEIFVLGPKGDSRSVSARTRLGPDGDIELYTPSAFGVSSLSLMALVTHELLHKVSWSEIGGYVDDNTQYGGGLFLSPDGGGRQLNDIAGALLALYYSDEVFGKVPVLTADAAYTCHSQDLEALFGACPYFATPTTAQLSQNPGFSSQTSPDASKKIKQIDKADFTAAAWVRVDEDAVAEMTAIANCVNCSRVILSNQDWGNNRLEGLELVLLQDGNFGVYAGTGKYVDSGLKLTPGKFHLVAARRKENNLETFVDGLPGIRDSGLFAGALRSVYTGVDVVIGRPGDSGNGFWRGYWKGNIAQVVLFERSLSDGEIGNLHSCGLTVSDTLPLTAGPSKWNWIGGSNYGEALGIYGVQGVPSPASSPGARSESASAQGPGGTGWLFGGSGYGAAGSSGYLNDLWFFDGQNWIWLSGSTAIDKKGVYPPETASSLMPGGREQAVLWAGPPGQVWLFGGDGRDASGSSGRLNDLWKFDGTGWTFLKGTSGRYGQGVYGTLGVAAAPNTPGARRGASGWTDAAGNLWLFGGYGEDSDGDSGSLNDLWKFDGTAWTWMGGSNTAGAAGSNVSGNQFPSARHKATAVKAKDGGFLLFGGYSYNDGKSFNELWKYKDGLWTLLSGSLGPEQQLGIYGMKGVPAATNRPGARSAAVGWSDAKGNFWLFGGDGYSKNTFFGSLNDLWMFDGAQWTWQGGSDTAGSAGFYGVPLSRSLLDGPGSRKDAVGWLGTAGKLMLFGGYGRDSNASNGVLSDLWSFTP